MTSRRRTKQSSSRDAKAPPSSGHDKLFRRSRAAPIPAIQPCRQRERLLPLYRPSGSLGDNHLNTLWMGQDGSYKYAASSSTFLEGPHLVSTLVAFSLPFSNQHPPTPSRFPVQLLSECLCPATACARLSLTPWTLMHPSSWGTIIVTTASVRAGQPTL